MDGYICENNRENNLMEKEAAQRNFRKCLTGEKDFPPDITIGLTENEVQERREKRLTNDKVKSQTRTVGEIIKRNVFTYFNFIFFILGVLLAMVSAWKDMLFLAVIVANTVIGIIQEMHSKAVLDKLSILAAPRIVAVRDKKEVELPSEELVQDDVIVLGAGNQIPADAVVLSGELLVNEALLTGEADEVAKKADDALLSGSFVVSGKATARLTRVGKESYISNLTMQATKEKDNEQSKMMRALDGLILVMGILIIPIGIALFVQAYMFNDNSLHDSVTGMVAAVIGMIPEGLYLLATVAMAAGAIRLAKKQVLVHDMRCIEGLARVDVLCVDKTGTITEAGMEVVDFLPADASADSADESTPDSADESTPDKADDRTQEAAGIKREALFGLLADFAYNMPDDNETIAAVRRYFCNCDMRANDRDSNGGSDGGDCTKKFQKAKQIIGFSSATKYSAAEFSEGSFVLGAPEFVAGQLLPELKERIAEYADKGYRVLVFARDCGNMFAETSRKEDALHMLDKNKTRVLGIVVLSNPIRSGAKEIFSHFAEHEVEIKVISGDNPETVSAVAEQAGILNADRYVDAARLKNRRDYLDAVERYTVFGRVTPEQKRELISALKEQHRTVAMTGDGVNDVLALKCADCSIAMASGSDAAANVAQLVLLDSDFSRLPAVVLEGRRVVNNMERTASLYIVKNIFSMLLAIFSVLFMFEYPLEPAQITLISMFTIGIPSVILALEPNKKPIKGHFLFHVLLAALPAGLTDFIVVSGLVVFCREFKVGLSCLSTSCTVLVALVGFMILYRIAKPMTKWHVTMLAALVAGWLFCMLHVSCFFSITGLSKQCAMLMALFALITEPCMRYLCLLAERAGRIPILQRLLK